MKHLILFMFVSFAFCSGADAQFTTQRMTWYKQPSQWKVDGQKLIITADPKTDFWQKTHYGYSTDNGHFYYTESVGDFEATVKVTGTYKDLYDQAGLMIRTDSKNWIKSGIEFVNGGINISAVYTREFSDWSVISRTDSPVTIWLKLIRKNDSVELSYSVNGKDFEMQRLGYFPPKQKAMIGIMAAAPEGKGFSVSFEDFDLKKL
jgi:regulation of enolase protein 1 (concanavalin A-like superfamily)